MFSPRLDKHLHLQTSIFIFNSALSGQLTPITSIYFNLFPRKLILSLSWISGRSGQRISNKVFIFPWSSAVYDEEVYYFSCMTTINCCIAIDKNRRIRTKYFLGIRICLINLSSERCNSSSVLRSSQHNSFFNCSK